MSSVEPKSWQSEREKILHRVCANIRRRVQKGHALTRSIRSYSWYWSKRCYKAAPGRRVRISRSTLIRVYYYWLRNGQNAEALRLQYREGAAKIPTPLVIEFLNRCKSPGIISIQAVFRSLKSDWERGKSIPGLGTWRNWARRHKINPAGRHIAPRFPFSVRTFYRCLSGAELQRIQAFHKVIGEAQSELRRFDSFVASKARKLNRRGQNVSKEQLRRLL